MEGINFLFILVGFTTLDLFEDLTLSDFEQKIEVDSASAINHGYDNSLSDDARSRNRESYSAPSFMRQQSATLP
jgi:hypothetical protein